MHRLSEGFFKIPKIASLKDLLQKASEKLKANKNSRSYLKQKTVRVPCPLLFLSTLFHLRTHILRIL